MDVVTDWPSQSPDLNVIENLWAIVKNRIFKRNPKNIYTFWTIINEEFFDTVLVVVNMYSPKNSFLDIVQIIFYNQGSNIFITAYEKLAAKMDCCSLRTD